MRIQKQICLYSKTCINALFILKHYPGAKIIERQLKNKQQFLPWSFTLECVSMIIRGQILVVLCKSSSHICCDPSLEQPQ